MKDFNTLKAKIQRGQASEEEIEQFRQYIEQVAWEEMERAELEPRVHDHSEEWGEVLLRIQDKQRDATISTDGLYVLTQVAAAICVGILVWAFYGSSQHADVPETVAIREMTVFKGKSHIKLQDGTTVDLNAGSTLTYSPDFGAAGERVVQLEGEAFFDVAEDPNRPFLVKTGNVTTRVLGTAFDVRAYRDQNDIVVTVARGKVSVSVDGGTALLTKNQQITYNRESSHTETREFKADSVLHWKADFLILEDITVGEALERIADRFHVTVTFEDKVIQECKVHISFVHSESLDDILDVLGAMTRAQIQVDNNVISVRGGAPCD